METETLPACYRHPDRETGVSCVECGRPICHECMRQGPVGQRCPDCATQGRPQVIRPRAIAHARPVGTYALIAACVLLFVAGQGGGRSVGALRGIDVQNGDYAGLVTSMFLHGSPLHLLFNMFALWQIGPLLETRYGTPRYLALYLVGGLWGAAGALALMGPLTPVVGASGAIFGLMAGIFVVERRHGVPVMGGIGMWIALNLVFTFTIPNISIGGHIGGLLGGAVATVAIEGLARRGRANRAVEIGVLVALAVIAVATAFAVAG